MPTTGCSPPSLVGGSSLGNRLAHLFLKEHGLPLEERQHLVCREKFNDDRQTSFGSRAPQIQRSFEDLIRLYYVAFSRPQICCCLLDASRACDTTQKFRTSRHFGGVISRGLGEDQREVSRRR